MMSRIHAENGSIEGSCERRRASKIANKHESFMVKISPRRGMDGEMLGGTCPLLAEKWKHLSLVEFGEAKLEYELS